MNAQPIFPRVTRHFGASSSDLIDRQSLIQLRLFFPLSFQKQQIPRSEAANPRSFCSEHRCLGALECVRTGQQINRWAMSSFDNLLQEAPAINTAARAGASTSRATSCELQVNHPLQTRSSPKLRASISLWDQHSDRPSSFPFLTCRLIPFNNHCLQWKKDIPILVESIASNSHIFIRFILFAASQKVVTKNSDVGTITTVIFGTKVELRW